jgi:methionyl-tRNA synthetase
MPYNVPANQFMNLEGQKISTSRNWAVWVHEFLNDYPDKADELRYTLIKNMPENKDSEFTWKSYQDSVNNELVANLANFVNRVVVLTHKYYEGEVPEIDEDATFLGSSGEYGESEYEYFETELVVLHDEIQEMNQCIRDYQFKDALKKLMDISKRGNQLLQYNEPWKLVKKDPETTATVINLCLQYAACLSVACRPFMPFMSDKMRDLLRLPAINDNGELNELLELLCEGQSVIEAGHKIDEPIHLFTRIEDSVISTQMEKLEQNKPVKSAEAVEETKVNHIPLKPEITIDDFNKIDLRTATIIDAKRVEKADKLLQLELDLGFEKRTVLSGIAAHYSPEEIVGKRVTIVANLAPRKMRGVESKGMILMAGDNGGKLTFVNYDEAWEDGSPIS